MPKDSIKLIVQFVMHVTKLVNTLQYYVDSLFIYNNSLNKNKISVITLSSYPGVGVEEETALSTKIQLYQNYPNPFNPSTTLTFSIPNYSQVVIKVFDILGREIQEIANSHYSAGQYQITFKASDLPSGVYFIQLVSENVKKTMKALLIK